MLNLIMFEKNTYVIIGCALYKKSSAVGVPCTLRLPETFAN